MKPKNLYQIVQENCNNKYDAKSVTKYVVVIRNTTNIITQERFKSLLFIALSKLIMKSINNFFKLVKTIPEHKRLHTPEDIAVECYLVLDRCVINVDMQHIAKFYYYFNNGLNKAIYRLYEQVYKKHFNVVDDNEEQFRLIENKGYIHNFDLTEIDLVGLNELEFEIIRSKLTEEKQRDAVKRLGITNDEFKLNFNNAKNKISIIYERNTIN